MKYWISINNGEVFEGHEGHLLDCFGVYPDGLEDFCKSMSWSFSITEVQ